jgi:cytochrome bd ubiquinol oxidase subunit II
MVPVIEPSIAILVIWILLYIYSMAGSIDFGASFWAMVYPERKSKAGGIANRFLSPTWEVTNTILVLLVVAFVGFFPKAAYMLGTVLLVPLSVILLLITLRSAFMVFAYAVEGYRRVLRVVSGVTGILVPGLLIGALPVTEGGFVRLVDGREVLELGAWLASPTVYMYMLFGLSSGLFLSSLFLADYARESEDEEAYRTYRRHAVIFGPSALLAAVAALMALKPEAKWLLDRLWEKKEWFLLSIIAFLIGYLALWLKDERDRTGRPRIAVVSVAVQYGLATFAYGSAHLPYIVYPHLTVHEAFTNIDTFYSLLKVFAAGVAVLFPGFLIFWRFFLKDKRYLQRG